jgi:peroxiredoxin
MSPQTRVVGQTKTRRRTEAPGPYNATVAVRRTRIRRLIGWGAGLVVATGLITGALISARPQVSETVASAPDFTLPDTDGNMITLSSLRGHPVILYFNEGAGCESCIYQMQAIEEYAGFASEGIVVLPIVMDPIEDIRAAMAYTGVVTPFLMDDGKVSDAYGTLGTGMHPGLPGHGFVLVNAEGDQVWQGSYPSMWLPPEDLLAEVQKRL